ncbi:hypothetical protein ACJZ2D_002288 [Fusarium nematophilum]
METSKTNGVNEHQAVSGVESNGANVEAPRQGQGSLTISGDAEGDHASSVLGRDRPFTVAEVAQAEEIGPPLLGKPSNAQPRILKLTITARILRHISSIGYLTEAELDTYQVNNFTRSMAFPFINAGYPVVAGTRPKAFGKFHEYANLKAWQNPTPPPVIPPFSMDMELKRPNLSTYN